MIHVSLRLPAVGASWVARCLCAALLALLAAGGDRRELWSDTAPADQIPVLEQVSPPDLNAVAATGNGAVVAVGDNGVMLRSTDQGARWTTVARKLTRRRLDHVISTPDGALVAVGESGTIIRSRDGGATWSASRHTGTDQALRRVLALSPHFSLVLQARTSGFTVIAFVTTAVKRVTIAAATMLAATRQAKRI